METPRPGDVLAGKYRVEKLLGQGGMGVVLGATHLQLQQPVAIKLMRTDAVTRGEALARFLREARAAAAIQSDHVCRVLDVATLEDETPYIVMEFLRGDDLGVELERRGRLPVGEAVDVVLQACEALAEAHTAGIVHRDLKPANLFLAQRPDGSSRVKVLDFGISKWRDEVSQSGEDVRLTRQNTTLGSPLYMSPEQMKSARDVDHRSDLWSLGAILYEAISGRPPFEGSSVTEVCAKIVQDEPAPLDGAPAGLAAAVARCLEKSRDRRWQNVAELAAALAPFGVRDAAAVAARTSRLVRTDASQPPVAETGSGARASNESRTALGPTVASVARTGALPGVASRRGRVLLAAGAASLVLLVGAGLALRAAPSPRGSDPSPSSASPVPVATLEPPSPTAAPSPAPVPIATASAPGTATGAPSSAPASGAPAPVAPVARAAPTQLSAAGMAATGGGARKAPSASAPPPAVAPHPSPLDTAAFGGRK